MTPEERLEYARDALEGLSVGDAFGEGFFMSWEVAFRLAKEGQLQGPPYDFDDEFMQRFVDRRELPRKPPWKWTDDTALALCIYENLREHGQIEADDLARRFSHRYNLDPMRGFGAAMHDLLPRLIVEPWREAASGLFNGSGSWGNGGAMRVAPIGAYFCDDVDRAAQQSALSAQVTHAHPEGVAGAMAVGVAAALAARLRDSDEMPEPDAFLDSVLPFVPDGRVKDGILEARKLGEDTTGEEAADVLGAGQEVSAQDTVPFCLWCAAQHLDFYEEGLWLTVSGLGDRDTTCAIVGGILGARFGTQGIPEAWRAARESLPV